MSTLDGIGLVAALLYGLATTFLASQGLHSLWLLWRFLRARRPAEFARSTFAANATDKRPAVLVQLPVYNERDVVVRLVAAAGAMQWPRECLRIQLLDDSTDDSVQLGATATAALRAQGIDAVQVRRADRAGFKAGALAHGLLEDAEHAQGPAPFVAIFDADFVPPSDFLHRALLPLDADDGIAFVQGRWEHLNANLSLLTRAQAIGIDGHFAIEQAARAWSGLALNFNGTCGVWRRSAIEDSGGWQHDTLTEDLDLSYRAQLRGWRAAYAMDLAVPGELPPTLEAWRAQQFRWAKGSLQTARKLLPSIWRAHWSATRKLAATMHLSHYLVHPAMVLSLLLAPVATLFLRQAPALALWLGAFLLLAGLVPPLLLYITSQRYLGRPWHRLLALPALMSFGTGIALCNARAAWQAFAGAASPFVRTPKHGSGRGSYRAQPASGLGELGLAAIGAVGLAGIWTSRSPWLAPIVALYVLGFLLQGLQLLAARLRDAMAFCDAATPDPMDPMDPIAPSAATRLSSAGAAWPFAALGAIGVAAAAWLAAAASHRTWQAAPFAFAGAGLLLGACCFAGTMWARRAPPTMAALACILAAGVLMHTLALQLPLSDDVSRYAVEGAQLLQYENPYTTPPSTTSAIDLASLPGAVNHAEMTSIYPPAMLWVHAAVMSLWPPAIGFRGLALLGTGIVTLLGLVLLAAKRRAPTLIVAVAWNPALILFTAGQAHHDVIAAVALLGSLLALQHHRPRTSILLVAIAALLKPFAIAALPVMLAATSWRHLWIPMATVLVAYAPFADAGRGLVASLLTFGGAMQFHGAIEPLLRSLLIDTLPLPAGPLAVRVVLGGLLLAGMLWLLRRSSGELTASRVARSIALLLLCLPTLHPWYFTLLVVLLPFTHSRALLGWTVAAPLYWLHGVAIAPTGEWAEWRWAAYLAHLPFLAWMLAEAFGPLRVPEPRAAHSVSHA